MKRAVLTAIVDFDENEFPDLKIAEFVQDSLKNFHVIKDAGVQQVGDLIDLRNSNISNSEGS